MFIDIMSSLYVETFINIQCALSLVTFLSFKSILSDTGIATCALF